VVHELRLVACDTSQRHQPSLCKLTFAEGDVKANEADGDAKEVQKKGTSKW
jgi:hypothetical protein